MKSRITLSGLIPSSGSHRIFLGAIATLLATASAHGQRVYWDPNGTAANTGTTADGVWDGTGAVWNADENGGVGTLLTDPTSDVIGVFSSGSGYTGASTVTVQGTRTARHLIFEEGTVALEGSGTVMVDNPLDNAAEIRVDAGATGIINSGLGTGAEGIKKVGTGTLVLGDVWNQDIKFEVLVQEGRLIVGAAADNQTAINGLRVRMGGETSVGDATLSLSRNLEYNSEILIQNVSLTVNRISGGGGLGSGEYASITGLVTLQGNLTLGNGAGGDVGGVRLSGGLSGSGGITVDGAEVYTDASSRGTIAIIGGNGSGYTGNVTVNRGVLYIEAGNSIGTGAAIVSTAPGAALSLSGPGSGGSSITIAGLTNIGAAGGVVTNFATSGTAVLTLAGNTVFSYRGSVQDGPTAQVALSKTGSGTQILEAANSYTGATTISSGTLQIGNGGATGSLAAAGTIVNNGILTFNRTDTITQGTEFSATGISGSGRVVQAGSGTLALIGSNSYSGLTTIDTGTLALGVLGTIDNTSGVALANGGTFDVSAKLSSYSVARLTGTGTVRGALTVSTQLAIGNSPGTTTFTGDLTLGGASVSDFEFIDAAFGAGTYDLAQGGGQTVTFGGTLNLLFGGGTYQENTPIKIFDFTTYSGNFSAVNVSGLTGQSATFDPLTGTVTVVPEPGVALLGGLGLLSLLRRRRVS